MIVYRTPYRNVIIPKRSEEVVGLTFSGGADSVILLYCMVMNNFIPDRLLYIYREEGTVKDEAMWKTLSYIENKFQVDLKSRLYRLQQDKKEMARLHIFAPMEECDVLYTGTTQNPQVVLAEGLHTPMRPPTGMVNAFRKFENPFGTHDKRATIFLYDLLGVNDLLELTRSCHVNTPATCGKCFHCLEREWAINEVKKLHANV